MRTAEAPFDRARGAFDRGLQRHISGVGYFPSPAPVPGASPRDAVLARGTMTLWHYRSMAAEVYRVPLLMVMSPTNRGYIFDMVPGHSLVEYLLKAGFDVFMLEWNVPDADESDLRIEDYVLDFVPACAEAVAAKTGEPDLTVTGYCFGGLISLLWAALHPRGGVKNLVCFSTPVDFKAMAMLQAWADPRFFDVDRLVETFGNCPPDLLLAAFEMLRPNRRFAVNARLWTDMWSGEYAQSYRMFDRWARDMLPLPGEAFRQVIEALVWENRLNEGTMALGGKTVDLAAIHVPFLHVVAQHDHVVPRAASAPLIAKIGSMDKAEMVLKGGHVTMVAGGNAVRRLWPGLDRWLQVRSL